MLRGIGIAPTAKFPASIQREQYELALKSLIDLKNSRPLSAEEAADLGALLIRLNRIGEAMEHLRLSLRQFPAHFPLSGNLGTALQLSGDLAEADRQLGEAIRLAPAKWKPFEEAQRKLVQLRRKRTDNLDDLFGIPFTDDEGKPMAEGISATQRKRLPTNDIALVQQLALWLPADGMLLWQLAELANAHGDVRTAANILEGCVGEFGMGAGDIRERRRLYKLAAEAISKLPDSEHAKHRGDLAFASVRPYSRQLDESKLPAIKKEGTTVLPWAILSETTVEKPFLPKYLNYLEKLDGLSVSLTGFEFSTEPNGTVRAFLLVEFPVGCWFCESPDPNGIIRIELAADTSTTLQRSQIRIEGKLKLNRDDAEDYLFSLSDAKIKPLD